MIDLVTGYHGEPHITAKQTADFNKAIISEDDIVFDRGSKFSASMLDNNTCRILDGDMLLQGRYITQATGSYTDVTIDNGSANTYRKDLIVIQYERDVNTGIEEVSFVVIKGTPKSSEASATVPTYTDGDIDSDLLVQFPLWVVPISGISVGTLEPQFTVKKSQSVVPDIVKAVFPVGSIYMSVNNVNPSTYFGGTWVAWGAGRVPVGVDTTQTEFNTVEKTGGEKEHTLTETEMPAHKHGVPIKMVSLASPSGGGSVQAVIDVNDSQFYQNSQYMGGSQAHNILQPYVTCYMWKRTA